MIFGGILSITSFPAYGKSSKPKWIGAVYTQAGLFRIIVAIRIFFLPIGYLFKK